MLRLRIAPNVVSVENDAGELESFRAVVALTVDGGKVGICSAAETEAEMLERMGKQLETHGNVGKNLVAKALVAEAEKRGTTAKAPGPPAMKVIHPGEDPWWDRRIVDPYSLRQGEHQRSHDPREILVVHPLAPETFSPYLLRGLLVYVFWTCSWTRNRAFLSLLHPKIELFVDPSITGTERAEVVDTVRHLWGKRKVVLSNGESIPPLPRTRQESLYRLLRVVWWTAALAMMILAYPEPSVPAVIAGIIAAGALFSSRVLRARLEVARPRRAPEEGAESA